MEKYLETLKKVTLFKNIDENEIVSLLSCLSSEIKKYKKTNVIFSEGDIVDRIGIILSGEVQVIKEDYYGNRNIVTVLTEGNLFGETFVCSDVRILPISVVCVTDCTVMFIDYKKLITTCSKACSFHNKLILNMLRIVANKNIFLNQKIEFVSKRSTREKLLSYLSAEAKSAGNNNFNISLDRQELADYLFVERSAMSAELSKLKKDKIITYNKNNFTMIMK